MTRGALRWMAAQRPYGEVPGCSGMLSSQNEHSSVFDLLPQRARALVCSVSPLFDREEPSFARSGGGRGGRRREEAKTRSVQGLLSQNHTQGSTCVLSVCLAATLESVLGTCLPDLARFDLCFL